MKNNRTPSMRKRNPIQWMKIFLPVIAILFCAQTTAFAESYKNLNKNKKIDIPNTFKKLDFIIAKKDQQKFANWRNKDEFAKKVFRAQDAEFNFYYAVKEWEKKYKNKMSDEKSVAPARAIYEEHKDKINISNKRKNDFEQAAKPQITNKLGGGGYQAAFSKAIQEIFAGSQANRDSVGAYVYYRDTGNSPDLKHQGKIWNK